MTSLSPWDPFASASSSPTELLSKSMTISVGTSLP